MGLLWRGRMAQAIWVQRKQQRAFCSLSNHRESPSFLSTMGLLWLVVLTTLQSAIIVSGEAHEACEAAGKVGEEKCPDMGRRLAMQGPDSRMKLMGGRRLDGHDVVMKMCTADGCPAAVTDVLAACDEWLDEDTRSALGGMVKLCEDKCTMEAIYPWFSISESCDPTPEKKGDDPTGEQICAVMAEKAKCKDGFCKVLTICSADKVPAMVKGEEASSEWSKEFAKMTGWTDGCPCDSSSTSNAVAIHMSISALLIALFAAKW
eukprot:gnl/TRDRNA2_/TRDRNA2_176503_c2_seq4.p1 gnl/TRDRNA2_/TRDRNA2_176503_c2~~gnl/TRDRNA2_/TRDRNA2_176503_c2_seq4.p1  ORF type:complete len:262 (+),score=41.57 gnl/TRDRNA2_/TRDRNA2_176503_c2_seq4:1-786(+)